MRYCKFSVTLSPAVIGLALLGMPISQGSLSHAADGRPMGNGASVPGLEEIIHSREDLWGEAALRQPNGASYEFFEPLLPPPRYVNADFRYYPLVLSAPRAVVKARLISNGSGINLRAGARSWNEVGTPVHFRVGPDEFTFGGLFERVTEPTLAQGYLPIFEIRYLHPTPVRTEGNVRLDDTASPPSPEIYCLEAFASCDPSLAENAVVFVKFSLAQGSGGIISVQVDSKSPVKFADGRMVDERGRALALFDSQWTWERGMVHAKLGPETAAVLAVPTRPLDDATAPRVTPDSYRRQRQKCIEVWREMLAGSMTVETPEPRVNQAWRNLLIQNFGMQQGDRVCYSVGNQYAKLYEAEGSDAALATMMWGFEDEMRRMIVPLLDFTRKGLEYHQAGLKLNDVCRLYWQTRDAAFVESLRPRWEKELRRILDGRTKLYSLFPKEQYCGDISTPVHSLSASSKAWRAVRDLATVLTDMGQTAEGERLAREAAQFRTDLLAAIDKSVRRETNPPFVPIALLDVEPAHDPITATRIGSYWSIVIGNVISSGIFLPGSPQERWIPEYLQQRGGLCMGMPRCGGPSAYTFWTGSQRINSVYGTRYVTDLLRRDQPERALVSFYGMLAQGFTRNTLNGGEGCTLTPLDAHGRFFYCPPNSAGNGFFLTMLRHLLVQDFDLDDDGRPDTLRLAFATPRRWLQDGQSIRVQRAPTAFGPVSYTLTSKLRDSQVLAEVDLPQRNRPTQTWLRIRVPDGYRVVSARAATAVRQVDPQGTVNLSDLSGHVSLSFQVERAP